MSDRTLADNLSGSVEAEADAVGTLAGEFLALAHDHTPGALATQFCRECTGDGKMVDALVQRDDHILRMSEGRVIPGPAFELVQGVGPDTEADPEEGEVVAVDDRLPPGVSQRVWNMLLMGQDLKGKIEDWL